MRMYCIYLNILNIYIMNEFIYCREIGVPTIKFYISAQPVASISVSQ